MARRCMLTGKGVMTGNNVSHAHNKTRRVYRPNLQITALYSEALNQMVRLKLTTSAIRSVEHAGGLDAFMLDSKDSVLDLEARRLKRRIRRALAKKAA